MPFRSGNYWFKILTNLRTRFPFCSSIQNLLMLSCSKFLGESDSGTRVLHLEWSWKLPPIFQQILNPIERGGRARINVDRDSDPYTFAHLLVRCSPVLLLTRHLCLLRLPGIPLWTADWGFSQTPVLGQFKVWNSRAFVRQPHIIYPRIECGLESYPPCCWCRGSLCGFIQFAHFQTIFSLDWWFIYSVIEKQMICVKI